MFKWFFGENQTEKIPKKNEDTSKNPQKKFLDISSIRHRSLGGRRQLWCEAANTATMLDNILVHEQNSAPPHTRFYRQDAKYANHLRIFGEICVIADTSNKVGRTNIDT